MPDKPLSQRSINVLAERLHKIYQLVEHPLNKGQEMLIKTRVKSGASGTLEKPQNPVVPCKAS